MKWYENLYTDRKTENKIKQIKWRLNHGAGSFHIYLITLSTASRMQLDILHAGLLKQPMLRKGLPMIVGVASSYEDAQELVIQMIQDVLEKTGSADVRGYFEAAAAEVHG